MRNITGAVAEGEDFFDRTREMDELWDKLHTDNVLLLAPRRVGKTSLMKRMAQDAPSNGYHPVFVDVGDCSDELRFVQRLYSYILRQDLQGKMQDAIGKSWLGTFVKNIHKIGAVGVTFEFNSDAPRWDALGEELARMLGGVGEQWLIEIDELPVFIQRLLLDETNGRTRVREFLYWMRRVRLEYRVRWLLAGSVGLDTVAGRINSADTINDLHIVRLGAFSKATADGLLSALAQAYNIPLESAVRGQIFAKVGEDWLVPYYLQLVFHGIRTASKPTTPELVDEVLESLIGPHHRNYFDFWRQRLTEELGSTDAGSSVLLLNACCYEPSGASRNVLSGVLSRAIADTAMRDDKLRYLLDTLVNDGYLVEPARDRWRFISPLLREYWLRRIAPPPMVGA